MQKRAKIVALDRKMSTYFSQKLSQIDPKILKGNGIFPFLVNPDSNMKDFKVRVYN